jgi:hypothetical protein
MSEARVKAKLWVQMALRLGDLDGRPGAVLRTGDSDAGGVLVVLRGRDAAPTTRLTVLSQLRTGDGEAAWMRGTGPTPVDQATADAYIDRQTRTDPDLWVIEFDSPDMLPPFQAKIV